MVPIIVTYLLSLCNPSNERENGRSVWGVIPTPLGRLNVLHHLSYRSLMVTTNTTW